MSRWNPRTTRNGLDPSNPYYWDTTYNTGAYFYTWYPYQGAPNAVWCNTYNLALPNCTTYALGRILEAGDSRPLNSNFPNANAWHDNLANGWTAIPYNINDVEAGDILEWSSNHVAVVELVENGTVYVSESAYTDDNGGVSGDRTDTLWGTTKQSVYNRGVNVYPNRFFHYGQSWYGSGNPTYILKNPNPHNPDPTNHFSFFAKKRLERKRRKICLT